MPDWTFAFVPVVWSAVGMLMWKAYSDHVRLHDGGLPPLWRRRPLVAALWPVYGLIFIGIGLYLIVSDL